MARTLTEITTELKENFVNNSTIQSFYNLIPGQTFDQQFSKVSLEGIIFYVVAYSIWVLEKLMDDFKAWLVIREQELIIGNTAWYKKILLEFQDGDALVFDGKQYNYPTINEANKIVKLASVTTGGGNILMKVANIDSSDNIIQLTSPQMISLKSYMNKKQFAGVNIAIVSRPADKLKLFLHIYIDSLVMNPNGSLISNPSVFPAENTINNYIKKLPFDSRFNPNELIDYLQATDGILNPVFDSAEYQYGSRPYTPIVDYYNPNGGYFEIDSTYPLNTTITYILA